MIGWIHRALAATQDTARMERWWGGADWPHLTDLSREDLVAEVVLRFERELKYRYVLPCPIYERENNDRIMYYMIHASDHEEAPKLMNRAYRQVVRPQMPSDLPTQEDFDFGEDSKPEA